MNVLASRNLCQERASSAPLVLDGGRLDCCTGRRLVSRLAWVSEKRAFFQPPIRRLRCRHKDHIRALFISEAQRHTLLLSASPLGQPQEPVRHTDNPRHALPIAALLRIFNSMLANASKLIKLEDEQAREAALVVVLLPRRSRTVIAGRARALRGLLGRLVQEVEHAVLPGVLAARLPAHDESLAGAPAEFVCERTAALDHALRDDLELDVANHGHAAPRYGRGPERCCVGKTPGDGGEVRVCRGKEM